MDRKIVVTEIATGMKVGEYTYCGAFGTRARIYCQRAGNKELLDQRNMDLFGNYAAILGALRNGIDLPIKEFPPVTDDVLDISEKYSFDFADEDDGDAEEVVDENPTGTSHANS